jgi:hypothetical protein
VSLPNEPREAFDATLMPLGERLLAALHQHRLWMMNTCAAGDSAQKLGRLMPEERKVIARKAGKARWAKKKQEETS